MGANGVRWMGLRLKSVRVGKDFFYWFWGSANVNMAEKMGYDCGFQGLGLGLD